MQQGEHHPDYNNKVFINCPFDSDYKPIFDAVVFTIFDCGFTARCALEEEDASQIRIEKIYDLISDCRYGIHDISRTERDAKSGLPRFNMPLESGIFLGAKKFGTREQRKKDALSSIGSYTVIDNLYRIFQVKTFRLCYHITFCRPVVSGFAFRSENLRLRSVSVPPET